MAKKLLAIVVGIEYWQADSMKPYPVEGSSNDVRLVQQTLREKFGEANVEIRTLINEQATRDRIVAEFRSHLIDQAKLFASKALGQPSPAFVFHFSGHGSEAIDPTGTQPNGRDQTIVPYDSRTLGVFDLKDWELQALIAELGQYTENITIILDTCYSGTATRSDSLRARSCPVDTRPQPVRPGFPTAGTSAKSIGGAGGTRSYSIAPRLPPNVDATHVLLAACQAHAGAFPYRDSSSGQEVTYGAMSFAFAKHLRECDLATTTYRELASKIRSSVKSWIAWQRPQCEGDRDRLLFQNERKPLLADFRVTAIDGDQVWVDVGAIHGLQVADELEVIFPKPFEAPRRSVLLVIQSIGTTASVCKQMDTDKSPNDALIGRSVVVAASTTAKHQIRLGMAPDSLTTGLLQPKAAAYQAVETIRGVRLDTIASADLILARGQGGWELRDAGGLTLARVPDSDRQLLLRQAIEKYAHWLRVGRIENPAANPLTGNITLNMHRVLKRVPSATGGRAQLLTEPIVPEPDRDCISVHDGTAICFEVVNQTERPIYFQLLLLGYDGSISRIYPSVSGEQVVHQSGSTIRTSGFRVAFDDKDTQTQRGRDYVKLFAATEPIEMDALCTDSSNRDNATPLPNDWTTLALAFDIER